jgi:hypothetical protein
VWAHRVTPERESESLPATAAVRVAGHVDAADLSLSHGEAIFPFTDAEVEVAVTLKDSEANQA